MVPIMLRDASLEPSLPVRSEVRHVSEGGRRVLDLLLKSQGMSQAEITRRLDLTAPTITRLLQGFQRDGMIKVASRQVDRPGNPSVQVTLHPDYACAIGVSMMGDVLSMILMDFAGQVRGERSAAMPSMSRKAVTEKLAAFRKAIFEETQLDQRRLIGAGVGLSGFYVGRDQWMNPPPYLDDWALCDIAPVLEDAMGLPVTVDNDGTLAAVGESMFGVGRHCKNFAYLHLTNGFGGGLIVDGKPIHGHHGNAGEFGGIWGLCCDVYPNLDLLQTCVAEAGRSFSTVEEMVQTITVDTPGTAIWLDLATPAFSLLCDILAYSNDPEMVVIGGRLPRSIAEALAARITLPREQHRRGWGPPIPKVVVSEAPGDAVAIGAAAVPLTAAFFG
jgi:predicted NBD/HSP70 family sugar kinase